jgi:hypothetical protein
LTESCRFCFRPLHQVLRHPTKNVTTLDLSGNKFGELRALLIALLMGETGTAQLQKIDLLMCALGDEEISILAQVSALGT